MREFFKRWALAKVLFHIDPRLEFWRRGVVIWLGTEISDDYGKGKVFDITIANVGFQIIVEPHNFGIIEYPFKNV